MSEGQAKVRYAAISAQQYHRKMSELRDVAERATEAEEKARLGIINEVPQSVPIAEDKPGYGPVKKFSVEEMKAMESIYRPGKK